MLVSPVWGWAAAGCTQLLDIDGEYTLEPVSEAPDAAPEGPGGFIGFGGQPVQAGGAWIGTDAGAGGAAGAGIAGGTTGAGLAASTGGVPSAAGGAETSGGAGPGGAAETGGHTSVPDAGSVACEPGTFTGRFSGSHKPSITFVGVALTVQGEVRFTLVKAEEPLKLILSQAVFKGELGLLSGRDTSVPAVPFSATMTGEYDCETRMLNGTLENGRVSDPNAPQSFVTFSGEFTAQFTDRGFTGTWREAEASPLEPSRPSPLYVGSGQFTAQAP